MTSVKDLVPRTRNNKINHADSSTPMPREPEDPITEAKVFNRIRRPKPSLIPAPYPKTEPSDAKFSLSDPKAPRPRTPRSLP